mgnify:CR=1 FL=1|jgi:GT2 family glycosyltransferase
MQVPNEQKERLGDEGASTDRDSDGTLRRGVVPLELVIGIATFRRPGGLSALLLSLSRQELPVDSICHLVVVDNDEHQSGQDVCDNFVDALPFPLTYASEPRRGLSFARNRLLEYALALASDVVIFVDDDERVSPMWLQSLVARYRAGGAMVVGGPVEPCFPADTPAWVHEGGFFLPPRHPDGAELDLAFTGNVLIDLRLVTERHLWFDHRFALSGGEDVDFFTRARSSGARMVWAADAVAYEDVARERLRARWLALRMFRSASCTVISYASIHGRLRTAHHWLPQCFTRVLRALSCFVATPVRGRSSLVYALGHLAVSAGIVAGMFGMTYREYAARQ